MGLSILYHPLNLFFREAAGSGDLDGLFLARPQVLGGDINDPIGIDIEGHIDLGDSSRRGGNSNQFESPQGFVIRGHLAFPLQHVDADGRLIVRGCREDLALPSRDGGVLLDEFGEYRAQGFDAQGEGGYIQKEDVFYIAPQNPCLYSGSDGNYLIGVDPLAGFPREDRFHLLLNLGHSCHPPHEDNVIDIRGRKPSILEGSFAWTFDLIYQVFHQFFQFGPR